MSFLDSMLKSAGIDPQQINNQIAEAGAGFQKVVVNLNAKLDRIESKLDLLLKIHNPQTLENYLVVIPPQDNMQ